MSLVKKRRKGPSQESTADPVLKELVGDYFEVLGKQQFKFILEHGREAGITLEVLLVFLAIVHHSWGERRRYAVYWSKTPMGKGYWAKYDRQEIERELGLTRQNVHRDLEVLKACQLIAEEDGALRPLPFPRLSANLLTEFEQVQSSQEYKQLLEERNSLKAEFEARKEALVAPLVEPLEQEYKNRISNVNKKIAEFSSTSQTTDSTEQNTKPVSKSADKIPTTAIDSKTLPTCQQICLQNVSKSADAYKERDTSRKTTPVPSVGSPVPGEREKRPITKTASRKTTVPQDDAERILGALRLYAEQFAIRSKDGGPWKPEGDLNLVQNTWRAGTVHGANVFQIVAFLYERFRYVLKHRRNAPETPGWFPVVVEEHFKPKEEPAAATPRPEAPREEVPLRGPISEVAAGYVAELNQIVKSF